MHPRLKKILAHKREEIAALAATGSWAETNHDLPLLRDFRGALRMDEGIAIIAEIKFASPSVGTIREESDPVPIGQSYERAGAAAVSLLTDERFFKGDLQQLPPLKRGISLPVLRKDFIMDPCQVKESSHFGADAILLISRILTGEMLKELLDMSRESGMAVLTEVHDRADLEKAIEAGADIIGINNRDLDTFHVDLQTTLALAPLVPGDRIVVSESGISSPEDISFLKKSGVDAVLVGTSLMESANVEAKIKELAEACTGGRKAGW